MILIKRYGVPLAAAVGLYSATYWVFGDGFRYMGAGLLLSVLLSYLIRICDDIGDYEKDRAAGKAPIRKGVLVAMGIFSALAILVAALMAKACLMIIPLLVILLQFLIKEPYRDVIKPLFVPTVVVTVVLSFFAPNFWMYVAVPILIIADVILIAYKRRRRGI